MENARIASRTTSARDLSDLGGSKGGLAEVLRWLFCRDLRIASGHGMWYQSNLLSGGFFPARSIIEQIAIFHWDALIHCKIIQPSLLGARRPSLMASCFPMFPRHPILLEGNRTYLWSGLLHSMLSIDPCAQPAD